MHKISIEDIELTGSLNYEFNDKISELEDCSVQANIDFKSMGDFIEAIGHVDGEVTLECDRCLNKFPYKLNFDIDETFAKNALVEKYGQELELNSGQFVTDLEGKDEIDVYDLLYQSVILSLPNKKVCGINCNEGFFVSEEEYKIPDSRMEVFKNIQIKEN